jgi:xylulokinase
MSFIGIDLGTTNLKVALFSGEFLSQTAICSKPLVYLRKGNHVEFDVESSTAALVGMLRDLGAKSGDEEVQTITLTGQAESLVFLGKNGKPLRPGISWMDERSSAECAEFQEQFSAAEVYAVTGQKAIIPTWPATKILHLSRTEKHVIAETAYYLMLKDYIAYRLTGVMAAEKSIATFSLYFDIHRGIYWQKMLDACGIRAEQLPPLVEPCTDIGRLDPSLNLGAPFVNTRVNTGTLDHFAGMIGNGIIQPGSISESTGTVMAMCTLVKLPLSGKENAALHYGPLPGTMAFLPVSESGGVCLEWFRNTFLPDVSFSDLDEKIISRDSHTSGNLVFLPYLVGTNAPDFDAEAKGVFYGLRSEINTIDMARAVMEGVALLLERNLTEMRKAGLDFSHIISSGGAAKSDIWSQIKADICNLEIRIPRVSEAACLGSAIIGAVSCGQFASYEEAVTSCVKIAKYFTPQKSAAYAAKRRGFSVLYRGMMETVREMKTV